MRRIVAPAPGPGGRRAGDGPADPQGAGRTLVRGLRLSPELWAGLGPTLLLAAVATAGKVVVPVAVQLTIDRGILAADGVRVGLVAAYALVAIAVLAATALAGYGMSLRLARATETALSNLRVRTFRHIHDLSQAHHDSEHRGALVSRVTADIDTISRFMQWGGVMLIVSVGQLLLATAAMAFYSWQLTAVVVVAVAPLAAVLRWLQRRLSEAYDLVRVRVGDLLTAVSETIMGAAVIRAYAVQTRANRRVAAAVDRHFAAHFRAARVSAVMFCSGEVFAATALAGVVAAGVLLGAGGTVTAGRLVAFMFLVNLFVRPMQVGTEVLDQAQTAVAGWRRVLDTLDTPADVTDPARDGSGGVDLPAGPLTVAFHGVGFSYPVRGQPGHRGPPVLRQLDLTIAARSRVAVVGRTGSGKSTFAKLLSRLADPTSGTITVNGIALPEVRFASLRRRIVVVPQEDFLFDASVLDNVRLGRPESCDDEVVAAFCELGLDDWLHSLPEGPATRVGERGNRLSVGERQLVAVARAYLADPDVLVLDEATSSVDPATEARLQAAMERLSRGRTTVMIAHRLSTAEAAGEVLVFDRGRIVERGPHAALLARDGVYRRLHEHWRVAAGARPDGRLDGCGDAAVGSAGR